MPFDLHIPDPNEPVGPIPAPRLASRRCLRRRRSMTRRRPATRSARSIRRRAQSVEVSGATADVLPFTLSGSTRPLSLCGEHREHQHLTDRRRDRPVAGQPVHAYRRRQGVILNVVVGIAGAALAGSLVPPQSVSRPIRRFSRVDHRFADWRHEPLQSNPGRERPLPCSRPLLQCLRDNPYVWGLATARCAVRAAATSRCSHSPALRWRMYGRRPFHSTSSRRGPAGGQTSSISRCGAPRWAWPLAGAREMTTCRSAS